MTLQVERLTVREGATPPEVVDYGPYQYAYLADTNSLHMSVGTIGSDEEEPPPVEDIVATGATAGIPGTWTPAGATVIPATVAEAAGIVADPDTGWTTGQFVQGSTTGAAGRMTWSGTDWVGGVAP